MNYVKTFLKKFYQFNIYNRDCWVQKQAKTIKKDLKVLDVGAGSAPYRYLFAHCDYKTQDFAQLKKDQLRGKKGYNKIDIVSDITDIPIKNESLDVILCTEVLEHLPYPIEAIKEMSRILKKDGILILTAPLGSGIHQAPYHFYGGYTPFFYEKILSANNMILQEISSNMGFFSLFSQELLRFLKKTAPWKSWINILLIPIWIILCFFGFFIPLISPFLDKNDKNNDFTVGYHIVARKI